ncbi:hypothetical protein BZA70DRAFT_16471 [Myxozyma melibiosi]|uniref:Cargo-transport protein YPP1 n=1 Tax=Myxozyma melibiosi TaxID=54550 RepID=A0ABR1FCC7_9ASCO
MALQSFDPATSAQLLRQATFPRSGEPNDANLVSYAEKAVQSWLKRGQNDSVTARALADFLYRAAAKTYQCQPILRCLMTVLIALGNYTDAERALNTYLEFADKGRLMAVKGSSFVDVDDALMTLRTATEGVVMLCRHVRDADKARARADGLKDWIDVAVSQTGAAATTTDESTKEKIEDPEISKVVATAWTAHGSAYALAARYALDAKTRTERAETANGSFESARAHFSGSPDTHYEHALLRGEFFQDLAGAIELSRIALALDSTHLGAAHVLALALSARNETLVEAREVCRTAVRDTAGEDSLRRRMTLPDKRLVLQVRMTEIALTEAVEGVQAALEQVSDGLFAVYNDLFTWDEDTVESQIHEASTSTISVPRTPEKKRNAIVPAAAPPTIQVTPRSSAYLDDESTESDSEADSEEDNEVTEPVSNDKLERLPQEKLSTGTSIPAEILAEVRKSSPRPKSMMSKRSLIIPRSIRRRLSDVSISSRRSAKSVARVPVTAAAIIEKNRGGANRVLRNSLSVDDAELKTISMQCLRDIWLLVAGLFRRGGRWAESATAITEATQLGGAKEDTFAERGFLMQAQQLSREALEAFEAALTVSIDYVPAIIGLANVLISLPEEEQPMARDRAFVLLETASRLTGWDSPEVWMLLGQVYEAVGDVDRVRGPYWRAIELEETRPVRRWRNAWMWETAQTDYE